MSRPLDSAAKHWNILKALPSSVCTDSYQCLSYETRHSAFSILPSLLFLMKFSFCLKWKLHYSLQPYVMSETFCHRKQFPWVIWQKKRIVGKYFDYYLVIIITHNLRKLDSERNFTSLLNCFIISLFLISMNIVWKIIGASKNDVHIILI